jgi:nucleosome assembly protein 1-like 1
VTASESDSPPSTTITISFRENEYFTNDKLSLTVEFKDAQREEVVKTTGTPIDWKDGKDLTTKKIKKKQKNKKTGETR